MEQQTISGQGPVKKFRTGAISATIWKNEGEKGTWHSISIERSYKDKNEQWQKTNNFRSNDLPKVNLVTQKAFEYLSLNNEEE